MCFGGGGTPAAPPPPSPPPQLAKTPEAQAVRSDVTTQNIAQGGVTPSTTLLTSGQGDTSSLSDKLTKKTLLGQ